MKSNIRFCKTEDWDSMVFWQIINIEPTSLKVGGIFNYTEMHINQIGKDKSGLWKEYGIKSGGYRIFDISENVTNNDYWGNYVDVSVVII